MTCWSTDGVWDTSLGLTMDGWCVVSEHMLVSILSVSVDPREMWNDSALSLAPLHRDMKPEDLLSPFLLMCVFKKLFVIFLESLTRLELGEFL